MKPINIVIADDHPLFLAGITLLLSKYHDLSILFTANNGMELIDKMDASSITPDVCIVDIRMPVLDGYETCKMIRSRFPNIKILALTIHDEEYCILKMLKCGANGYLTKSAPVEELRTALTSVVQNGYYHSGIIEKKLSHYMNNKRPALNLTGREIQVLTLFCSELSYKEIGERLYISHRTVETYCIRLCQKFGVDSRIGLAVYAMKSGIVSV